MLFARFCNRHRQDAGHKPYHRLPLVWNWLLDQGETEATERCQDTRKGDPTCCAVLCRTSLDGKSWLEQAELLGEEVQLLPSVKSLAPSLEGRLLVDADDECLRCLPHDRWASLRDTLSQYIGP